MPDPLKAYSRTAEKYARYRWDYAPEAISALFHITGLKRSAHIADVGAGTGILTRHFNGRVARVYAIEPNHEMRTLAAQALRGQPGCLVCAATAEAVPLARGSLDLVAAGQAVQWFQAAEARREFQRILKPGGWLALVSNRGVDSAQNAAIDELNRPEFGVDFARGPQPQPGISRESYFEHGAPQKLEFPFTFQQNWEGFWGALLTASWMPDESDPRAVGLEKAARAVFEQFSQAGQMTVEGYTMLWIGRIAQSIA